MNFATRDKPVFFIDYDYKGCAMIGGYFLRNPLKEFIQNLEDSGVKPVAIKFDGSFNLEIFVEPNENEKDLSCDALII